MLSAAVIPAKGIGDGLLMMIVSHQLREAGYRVTTFHRGLKELQEWFPGHVFETLISLEALSPFDLIVAENDNSETIKALRKQEKVSIFYPTFSESKHLPLSTLDQVFDPVRPMADNIAVATARLLQKDELSKENGITIPSGLIHRLHKKRIILHPTSSALEKNWFCRKYIKLAHQLEKRGFQPLFTVSKQERADWEYLLDFGFEVPEFTTLHKLAEYVYESGFMIGNDSLIGHLSSNLAIPTIIISNNHQRMLLWQPGWLPGKVITPAQWIPNIKGLRLREKYWQKFITTSNVLSCFDNLVRSF